VPPFGLIKRTSRYTDDDFGSCNKEKTMLSTFFGRAFKKLLQCVVVLSIAGPAFASDAGKIVLVSGKAEVAGAVAKLNDMVQEGATIKTGADGYVYLKTVDDGFLILRPNSEVRVVNYSVNKQDPSKTKIKFEMISGVVRSITGDAAKMARQNFRFNTPVAAIGIRGTDFVVYTNNETSRVSVYSGGVIASGFGQTCSSSGVGPCEGSASVELFARQQGQLLQITRDIMKPQLINGQGISPDLLSPPRSDEPVIKALPTNAAATVQTNALTDLAPAKVNGAIQIAGNNSVKPITGPENTLIWGRWVAVLEMPANVDLGKVDTSGAKVVGIGDYHFLAQTRESVWQVPNTGSLGFSMKESQAVVFDELAGKVSAASIENAKLHIDFASASFKTSFDLLTDKERHALVANGGLTRDGVFEAGQFQNASNMSVKGVVTEEKGGLAAYLFRARLDSTRIASGLTQWTKQ